jgi:hypothetical protein
MNHLKIILFAVLLAVASGCQSYLDINVDPNRPNDVTLQTLLPTVLSGTASFNYSTAYTACQYAQQIGGGVDDQAPDRMEGAWSTLYLTLVPNLNDIIAKAGTSAPGYTGIAKTLLAFNLGMATTFWENIPYSQSDRALSNGEFRPNFDTQEAMMTNVQRLLDEAIVELQKPAAASVTLRPAADDLIYAGNLTRWLRLAYTLKARFLMNTTKKNAQQAATQALAALANGISSSADDFQLTYAATNAVINPWRQIALANNTGNFSVFHGAYFINLMNTTTYPAFDPRLPLVGGSLRNVPYATPADYRGTQPGSAALRNVDFTVNSWYNSATAPLVMVTFAEAKLLEAEARFLAGGGIRTSTGSTAEAFAAYRTAISAGLVKLGVSAAEQTRYLAEPTVNMGAANLKLEHIMAEKYKALFLNAQVWTDLRRYDFDPAVFRGLALPEARFINIEANGNWAQRVLYPSTESARNGAVVQQNFKRITEKMWLF